MIIEYDKGAQDVDQKIVSLMESVQMALDAAQRSSDALKNKIDTFYPVGSIYMSVSATNPGKLFGGEWEQIKDKFLLAAGDTYKGGGTGGKATHVLSTSEMPYHGHPGNGWAYSVYRGTRSSETVGGISGEGYKLTQVEESGTWGGYGSIPESGGSQPHNNMPPYIAVYVWLRTK